MALRLYDLAGADPERRFSPYCWRIRLALAHKELPAETIPWRFTEKEAIAPSGQGRVPVLVDGERWIADSWPLANYLEDAYADRPSLFGGPIGRHLSRFYSSSRRYARRGHLRLLSRSIFFMCCTKRTATTSARPAKNASARRSRPSSSIANNACPHSAQASRRCASRSRTSHFSAASGRSMPIMRCLARSNGRAASAPSRSSPPTIPFDLGAIACSMPSAGSLAPPPHSREAEPRAVPSSRAYPRHAISLAYLGEASEIRHL